VYRSARRRAKSILEVSYLVRSSKKKAQIHHIIIHERAFAVDSAAHHMQYFNVSVASEDGPRTWSRRRDRDDQADNQQKMYTALVNPGTANLLIGSL
jgi:hypothetical protein